MFRKKIRLNDAILERIKEAMDRAGYSSIDEFIETAIERELERIDASFEITPEEEEKVRERLRGLGYIE
jgi:hypothetical protein